MVRVSSPAKLRPWSEVTAKMVMGVVPGLVKTGNRTVAQLRHPALSLCGRTTTFRATIACEYSVGACGRSDFMLCHANLFAYPC